MGDPSEIVACAAASLIWSSAELEQFDPCYHLGMSTEIINGQRGKGNFNVPPFPEPRPQKVAN